MLYTAGKISTVLNVSAVLQGERCIEAMLAECVTHVLFISGYRLQLCIQGFRNTAGTSTVLQHKVVRVLTELFALLLLIMRCFLCGTLVKTNLFTVKTEPADVNLHRSGTGSLFKYWFLGFPLLFSCTEIYLLRKMLMHSILIPPAVCFWSTPPAGTHISDSSSDRGTAVQRCGLRSSHSSVFTCKGHVGLFQQLFQLCWWFKATNKCCACTGWDGCVHPEQHLMWWWPRTSPGIRGTFDVSAPKMTSVDPWKKNIFKVKVTSKYSNCDLVHLWWQLFSAHSKWLLQGNTLMGSVWWVHCGQWWISLLQRESNPG